jgi:hypothetical protein
MTRGLFGPRHIHKRVLDIPLPQFTPEINAHVELATLGERLAERASQRIHAGDLRRSSARQVVRASLPTEDLARVEELVIAIFRSET